MIISEQQIMRLIYIAKEYYYLMSQSKDEVDQMTAKIVNTDLCTIVLQQSEELKEIK